MGDFKDQEKRVWELKDRVAAAGLLAIATAITIAMLSIHPLGWLATVALCSLAAAIPALAGELIFVGMLQASNRSITPPAIQALHFFGMLATVVGVFAAISQVSIWAGACALGSLLGTLYVGAVGLGVKPVRFNRKTTSTSNSPHQAKQQALPPSMPRGATKNSSPQQVQSEDILPPS